jgi:trimeric autotransporter adhesin
MGWLSRATGEYATALGVGSTASGNYSTALGVRTTASGAYSVTMGRHASAGGYAGTFVFGDVSTHDTITATSPNQFLVRAGGGVAFYTSGALSAGVTLAPGGGSWSTVSDRNRKEEFTEAEGERILERVVMLPVSTWRYIAEEDRSIRHIGPTAQDWAIAFPELGGGGLTINSGDFDGVNLAAIRALEVRTRSQQVRIAEQDERIASVLDENRSLRARLELLEARLGAADPSP